MVMIAMYHNILNVTANELCTGCATCFALCPNKAITIELDDNRGLYLPCVDSNKCINCEICLNVCPGYQLDFEQLSVDIHKRESMSVYNKNYIGAYVGYSLDDTLRYNSSSGGLITQILIFALEEGIIDGALVTRMKKDDPLVPEPFIARTKAELIEASKSKYCPVPANLALELIINSDDKEKFAVVGLPCHIHGIRKASQINDIIRKKVVFHLGLFCVGTNTFLATEYILKSGRYPLFKTVEPTQIRDLFYRADGWPGHMNINLKNNQSMCVPYFDYRLIFNRFFVPLRCLVCSDKTCELADLSFGDPHEISNDKIGESLIISNNNIGEALLKKALTYNKIELRDISHSEVLLSTGLLKRRRHTHAYRTIFRFLGFKVPDYNQQLIVPSMRDYFACILHYIRNQVTLTRKRVKYIFNPCSFLVSPFLPFLPHIVRSIRSRHNTKNIDN